MSNDTGWCQGIPGSATPTVTRSPQRSARLSDREPAMETWDVERADANAERNRRLLCRTPTSTRRHRETRSSTSPSQARDRDQSSQSKRCRECRTASKGMPDLESVTPKQQSGRRERPSDRTGCALGVVDGSATRHSYTSVRSDVLATLLVRCPTASLLPRRGPCLASAFDRT